MKSKTKRIVLLVIAVTFLLSSNLYAEYCYGERRVMEYSDREERLERIKEELGITARQEARLKKQREEFRNKNKKLTEKMHSKREELKQELEKPNINRAKVGKIVADIKNLSGKKLRNRVDKIISMKDVLTQEQLEKLQTKMEQIRQAKRKRNRNKRWFRRW